MHDSMSHGFFFPSQVSGDSVVVELLSERNWQTASNNITFGSTSAGEDGKLKCFMQELII